MLNSCTNCILHYAGIFIASMLGAGVGAIMVLRIWRSGDLTDEPDDDDRRKR